MKKRTGSGAKGPETKSSKAKAKPAPKVRKAAVAVQPEAPGKQLKLTPVQQILIDNQPTRKPRKSKRETSKTLGVYDAGDRHRQAGPSG
jgi:hypothetical protein